MQQHRPKNINKLNHSNLYKFTSEGTYTLLHGATKERMLRYCKLLIFFGFDMRYSPNTFDDDCESALELTDLYPSPIGPYFKSILMDANSFDDATSVETGYIGLRKQTRLGKLFTHYLGCFEKKLDKTMNIKAEDRLFYRYEECGNLEPVLGNDIIKANEIMQYLSKVCIELIKDKQPFSDDLLVMCYDYCWQFDAKMAGLIRRELVNAIDCCLSSIYLDDNNNVRNEENIGIKDRRSVEWFKRYILDSNIMLLPDLQNNRENRKHTKYSRKKTLENEINSNADVSVKTSLKVQESVHVESSGLRKDLIGAKEDSLNNEEVDEILNEFLCEIFPSQTEANSESEFEVKNDQTELESEKQDDLENALYAIESELLFGNIAKKMEEQEKKQHNWISDNVFNMIGEKMHRKYWRALETFVEKRVNWAQKHRNVHLCNSSLQVEIKDNLPLRQDTIEKIKDIQKQFKHITSIKMANDELRALELDSIRNSTFSQVKLFVFLFYIRFACNLF